MHACMQRTWAHHVVGAARREAQLLEEGADPDPASASTSTDLEPLLLLDDCTSILCNPTCAEVRVVNSEGGLIAWGFLGFGLAVVLLAGALQAYGRWHHHHVAVAFHNGLSEHCDARVQHVDAAIGEHGPAKGPAKGGHVAVSLEELTYSVPVPGGRKRLTDRVSAHFTPGSVSFIMGPSGCGKSVSRGPARARAHASSASLPGPSLTRVVAWRPSHPKWPK